jgi:hypothetical protein
MTARSTNLGYRKKADFRLQRYLRHFRSKPLYAKMLTAGVSSALQEITASWLAQPDKANTTLIFPLVLKMTLHGLLVKAPISQAFAALLQRLFKGSTGTRATVLQFLTSQLVVRWNIAFVDRDIHNSLFKIAP